MMYPVIINQSQYENNLGFNLPSTNNGAIFGTASSSANSSASGGTSWLSKILGTATTIGGQIRDTRVGVAQANSPSYYASQLAQQSYNNPTQTQNLAPSTVVNAAGGALDNFSDFFSKNLVVIGLGVGAYLLYKTNSGS